VSRNCEVASASQAGHFNLCGLLLRLRQLYKWEHGLPPWREPEPAGVLAWVEAKEGAWESLEGTALQDLSWNGARLDPFDAEGLNQSLIPRSYAYGAGYSRGLTPTCFLGELLEMRRDDELTILVLGPELARDLDATPALCQGTLIYARQQALAFYLWDRLSDPVQQNNPLLQLALEAFGLKLSDLFRDPEAHRSRFEALVDAELEACIRHEIGEAREHELREAFRTVVGLFPQTRLELWVRALKDALAELNEWGRVCYLIEVGGLASLALMLAWRPGLYSLLMPELEPAFWELARGGGWDRLEDTRHRALVRLRGVAEELRDVLAAAETASPQRTRREIEARFLAPLGL